jgi:hypothetical protein
MVLTRCKRRDKVVAVVVVVVQRDRDVLVREAGGVARGDKVLGQDWKKETSQTHTHAGGGGGTGGRKSKRGAVSVSTLGSGGGEDCRPPRGPTHAAFACKSCHPSRRRSRS